MFGLGTWELIVILLVALIFLGPNKLPELAKSLGRGVRQMRQAMDGLDREVRDVAQVPPARTDGRPAPAASPAEDDQAMHASSAAAEQAMQAAHRPPEAAPHGAGPDDLPAGRPDVKARANGQGGGQGGGHGA